MDMMGSMMGAAGSFVGAAGTVSSTDTQVGALSAQSDYARAAANERANLEGRRQSGVLASARASRGASGVVMNEGSPLMVDEAIVQEIALNEANVRHGGALEANRLSSESKLLRQASHIQMHTSLISGGKTMFQGLSANGSFGGAA